MARPKKDPAHVRSIRREVTYSPAEEAELQANMAKAETNNAVGFIRASSLGQDITVVQSTVLDFPARNEMGRIGKNLNQMLNLMESRKMPPPKALPEVLEQLRTILDEVYKHDPQDRQR